MKKKFVFGCFLMQLYLPTGRLKTFGFWCFTDFGHSDFGIPLDSEDKKSEQDFGFWKPKKGWVDKNPVFRHVPKIITKLR